MRIRKGVSDCLAKIKSAREKVFDEVLEIETVPNSHPTSQPHSYDSQDYVM